MRVLLQAMGVHPGKQMLKRTRLEVILHCAFRAHGSRREDHRFKAIVIYVLSYRPAWVMYD